MSTSEPGQSRLPVSIVVRQASDIDYLPGVRVSPVEEHNRIASLHGKALFGKFGSRLGPQNLECLRHSADQGTAELILVSKKKGVFEGKSAKIEAVFEGSPPKELRHLIPHYYAELEIASLWFLMREPFSPARLTDLRLLSSGRPLLEVIGQCRTASMLVEGRSKE